MVQAPQTKSPKMTTTPLETPSTTQELEIVCQVMLTPSFLGVTVCLRRDESLEGAHKVSSNPVAVGVMSAPGLATMSKSYIVRDKVTGVT